MDISQFGSMFIQLTQGYFTPGQQVNGTINLNLLQPINGANQIYLVWAGMEHVSLNQRQSYEVPNPNPNASRHRRTLTKYRNVRHNESQPVCNYRYPVYTFPGNMIPAGMYTFPFSFMLDANLPSSYSQIFHDPPVLKEEATKCNVTVEYNLMVFIDDSNPNTPPIKYIQKVMVNQGDVVNLGMHKCNIKKENTCFGCCSRGSTSLVSYFEKNEYCPGETAYVLAEIDNSTSSDTVISVIVTFSQKRTFKAGSYTLQYTTEHQHAGTNGVQGGSKLPAQRMEIKLTDQEGKLVTPTCRGKLVKSEYFLLNKAEVDTPCNCDTPYAEATMNLTIRNPDMAYKPWMPPANWQPKTMPVAQFQTGDQYQQQTFPNDLMIKPPVIPDIQQESGADVEGG